MNSIRNTAPINIDVIETASLNWITQGLCAQTDPSLFYPGQVEPAQDAIRICGDCLVQIQCREWALDSAEEHGVWGGLSAAERRRLRRMDGAAA